MNISRLISTLGKLEGASTKFTLTGKQILQRLEKGGGIPTEVSDTLAGLVRKHPKLKADVAYKVSEQGFVIGAATLKDGKKVIGNGAASVSGLGTEQAVCKVRLNAGENGEILRYSGFNDLAHTPKVQELETTSSFKNGILESTSKYGKFGAAKTYLDIPKATEAMGLKEEGAVILKSANRILDKITSKLRDLFAGKSIGAKVSHEDKLKQAVESFDNNIDKFYKMPNNKKVKKEEFEKVMEEYFELRGKQAEKNPDMAGNIIKELKSLKEQVKKQTGYDIQNDWTKYLDEKIFK